MESCEDVRLFRIFVTTTIIPKSRGNKTHATMPVTGSGGAGEAVGTGGVEFLRPAKIIFTGIELVFSYFYIEKML